MNLPDILQRISPLPYDSLSKICSEAEEICVDKNTQIIQAGKIERHVYFIKSGIARAYIDAEGREVTFWIGEEGSVALSMQSYVNGCPGYETIVTIERSVLYKISSERLHQLYEEDIHLSNWGRRFAESEILRAEQCLLPLLFTKGAERYDHILRHRPSLLQRMPLEHLASYIGLTPVSLSRIRATKSKDRDSQ